MRLIDIKAVADKLGVSSRTVHRLVAAGDLPKPVKLAERSQRWIEAEVDDWLASLPREKCQTPFHESGVSP